VRISFVEFTNGRQVNDLERINSEPLKVLCFGMGAIGTYIGGSLAGCGADVVFIERAEVIKGKGSHAIRLLLPSNEIRIDSVQVATSVREVLEHQSFDVALLAVKSFDTASLLESLQGLETKIPPILCLQNGVENEAQIAAKMGNDKVIAGTITSAVGKTGMGDVKLEKLRGVGIETGHTLSPRLIDWFNRAGLRAKGYPSRENMKWSKMLTNLLSNASSAILNWSPAQVLSNPVSYRIELTQIREALRVMKYYGIRVVNLPGTPVVPLMALLVGLPEAISRMVVGNQLAHARGAKMPSFHIDLYSERKISEVTFLNGAVARFGQKAGLATPVNSGLTRLLEDITAGKVSREEFAGQPEKLWNALQGE
jgi:2-dehydropantoate 2-reductase